MILKLQNYALLAFSLQNYFGRIFRPEFVVMSQRQRLSSTSTLVLTKKKKEEPKTRTLTLKLGKKEKAKTDPSRRVKWTEDTIDNENLGRKKSKKCCIFHKKRAWDQSDSER